jgi:hypothetical protein
MSNGLPCPNPACTYNFAHAQLKGAAALTCPKCGTVFHFQSSAAPAQAATRPAVPRPAVPVARRPAPAAAAPKPAAAARRPAKPVAAVPEPAGGNIISPALIRRRTHDQGSAWKTILVLGIFVVMIGGMVIGGLVFFLEGSRQGEEGSTDPNAQVLNGLFYDRQGKEERAFRLILPPGVWQGNKELKAGLKAVVALERTDPDAWLAVAVQDFGQRMPRDAELVKGAIERLEGYFGDKMELDERPQQRELAGRPAQVLTFRGEFKEVPWMGECWALANHGLAYWVILAGAQGLEQAQKTLEELQAGKGKGFVLADERKGWSEQPPAMSTFAGLKTRFTVTGQKAVWTSFDSPKEIDPNAELLLNGKDLQERKDNLKRCTFLVLNLAKSADDPKAALKIARDYVEVGRKEEDKNYKLVSVADKKGQTPGDDGQALKIAGRPGRMAELKLVRGDETVKYLLLAVLPLGDHVLVFQCEAHWQHHQAWRGDFLDLLASVRLGGKA